MILVAAEKALLAVDGREQREVGSGPVIALAGQWALSEAGDVVTSLTSGVVAPVPGPRALCVADAGDTFYVGTAEAHVLAGSADTAALTAVESFDRIATRDEWYTPWGAPPDTRSIAVGAGETLFVNVHVGGVWRSDDGEGWDEVIEVEADTHQVVTDADRGIVVAAAAVGVGRSLDNGLTWDWTDAGLHHSYCRAAAIAGDTLLVTASTGPGTRDGRVYRRLIKDDGPFEQCRHGLPERFPFNLDTGQLASHGDVVALGTGDGRLFVSDDAGATWQLLAEGLGDVRCVAV